MDIRKVARRNDGGRIKAAERRMSSKSTSVAEAKLFQVNLDDENG